MKNDITVVTGLFDLGRGELAPGFARSFDLYKEKFRDLLIQVDLPMVIYCEPELNSFVWHYRERGNTRIVNKSLAELKNNFPFYEEVQQIKSKPAWQDQAGWLAGSPQARLDMYNPLVMSKLFWLNDATLYNFFDTRYFLWMDGGIANTLNLQNYFDEHIEQRLQTQLNKMLYLCFPYAGKAEVHGFEKAKLDQLAGSETQWVCRGGIFGGARHVINEVNALYYELLRDTLRDGYMGTEESIFTLISYRYPHLCNLKTIEANGLVYKFFEDLCATPAPPVTAEKFAFYALTYNLPKQFEKWAESFVSTYPKEFQAAKKYVINNSNDPAVRDEYAALFDKYGFTEFKFDNIGINDGRFQAARHFHESGHEYMVFFEDDMLLAGAGMPACKNGFGRWFDNVFEIAADIMAHDDLDYLKLSFSEFYGDNHTNWAWHNLAEDKKAAYFPRRSDAVDHKRTRIDYTGALKGIPYTVGEFHYCNWPIMFNKRGNKTVFIDTTWEFNYEQTWMAHTMILMREKKSIKAGCLLGSIIHHDREFHYLERKENGR